MFVMESTILNNIIRQKKKKKNNDKLRQSAVNTETEYFYKLACDHEKW